ncbi:hypothetical protein BgiMline_015169 [Biomphalaria glabrata]|uniref:Uncharacterized protein n=1 Tax=Biomphalaria glabrata TaxID=6526 RepID=A0A2C9KVR4_BIOGL|nr:hypothetical protein BgiMline_022277 [Biomphalaria glabrata]
MEQQQRPVNYIQAYNEREPVRITYLVVPSAPKKVNRFQTLKVRAPPKPFDYQPKPKSARQLFPEPPASISEARLNPQEPLAPKVARKFRRAPQDHDAPPPAKKRLFY